MSNRKENEKGPKKMYDPKFYNSTEQEEKGLAITHEQVSDTLTEGTVDAKIDQLDEQGELKSHKGEEIDKNGF